MHELDMCPSQSWLHLIAFDARSGTVDGVVAIIIVFVCALRAPMKNTAHNRKQRISASLVPFLCTRAAIGARHSCTAPRKRSTCNRYVLTLCTIATEVSSLNCNWATVTFCYRQWCTCIDQYQKKWDKD